MDGRQVLGEDALGNYRAGQSGVRVLVQREDFGIGEGAGVDSAAFDFTAAIRCR